ncbi:hypothetical protein [Streptomyces albidus (ex Kaewkla and Franco 2022)]|uniref:hypothetical protein n=1 Tax=Streptomyces albidus (ex Kaewkla and Franco 2022) TaxID=722709 RepID=UPI0015EF8D94|nr:hypothetical protein [Streptomyces albidus (ex Kaewkla and Franco 2022)]
MDEFLPFLGFVGALAVVMGFFRWLAFLVRRRGLAGQAIRAALASHDEAFRVTAHDSHYEIQAQADRQVPMSSPGDPQRSSRDVVDQWGGDERGAKRRRISGLRRVLRNWLRLPVRDR